MSSTDKEALKKACDENKELANAFVDLYGILKQLMPKDEYNKFVAKSPLRDVVKNK